jgi:membrane-associated phospholipid phosphatase
LGVNLSFSQDSSSTSFGYGGRLRVLNNDPDNIDIRIFRSVNNKRTDFLDKSLTITDKSVLPAAIILPAGMFIYGRAKEKSYEENTGVLLALTDLTNIALTIGIKNIIKRERPYKTLSNVYHKNVSIKDEYSFPSNHAGTAFSIASTFALRYPKYPQIYVPMYLWGLAVGYGRMYFGMHYPSDVLGGAVLGSLSAITIYSLRSEIIKTKNKLFNEENRPDANKSDLKTAGWVSAIGFISVSAFEYFFTSSLKSRIKISPTLDIINTCFRYNLSINF